MPVFSLTSDASAIWRVTWSDAARSDHYLMERGSDDAVLLVDADWVYPEEDEFALSTLLPDEGAVLELYSPSECLTDTANLGPSSATGWFAGSAFPPASMERTDPTALDASDNWHTNLGIVRNGLDAFGDLIHGTPKQLNSPTLDVIAQTYEDRLVLASAVVPTVFTVPAGADVPTDESLWYVVVTSRDGVIQPATWTVDTAPEGAAAVMIHSTMLPRHETLHVWIRTPMGRVFFAAMSIAL